MSDNIFQQQIEQQMSREMIKGSLYNQKMADNLALNNNYSNTGKGYIGNYNPYTPVSKKVYKDQIVALTVSFVCALVGIIAIICVFR